MSVFAKYSLHARHSRRKLVMVNISKGVLGNLYYTAYPIAPESQYVTHTGAEQGMFILGPLGPKQIAIPNSILFRPPDLLCYKNE